MRPEERREAVGCGTLLRLWDYCRAELEATPTPLAPLPIAQTREQRDSAVVVAVTTACERPSSVACSYCTPGVSEQKVLEAKIIP